MEALNRLREKAHIYNVVESYNVVETYNSWRPVLHKRGIGPI